MSLGVRFATLPESSSTSNSSSRSPAQPPTTITGLFNPMMGHVSAAYTARVSRNLSLCSRFDFNVYSYDSEWTMGAEWWMRDSPLAVSYREDAGSMPLNGEKQEQPSSTWSSDIRGVIKARASTRNVSIFFLTRCPRSLFHRMWRYYGKVD